MHKFILIAILFTMTSCEMTNVDVSIENCYLEYHETKRNIQFSNSRLVFGKKVDNVNSCFASESRLDKYIKGAYKVNVDNHELTIFKYGLVRNDSLKRLVFDVYWEDKLIDSKSIIVFDEKEIDYFVNDNQIEVVKKRGQEVNETIYEVDTAEIRQVSTLPQGKFLENQHISKGHHIELFTFEKDTRREVLRGEVAEYFGSKWRGRYLLIKVDEDLAFEYPFVAIKEQETYRSCELFGLNTDELLPCEEGWAYCRAPKAKLKPILKSTYIKRK